MAKRMTQRMTNGTTQTAKTTKTETTKTTKTANKRTASSVPQGALSQMSLTLTDLPEKPKETWSLREVIEQLQEPITIAMQRGYRYEELVEILASCDIHITASSLKRYLSIAKRANAADKPRQTRSPKRRTIPTVAASQPEAIVSPADQVMEMSPRRRRSRTAVAAEMATTKTAAKAKATSRTTAARKRNP